MRALRSPRSIAFLLCVAALLVRGWPRVIHARFWAEDGALFFAQSIAHGPRALLEPYAGYFHFAPRLISFAAAPLPIGLAPLLYILVCVLIMAACFSELASARSGALRLPAWLRIGACVALCFAPGMPEVWGNLANLHAVLFLWLALLAMRREGSDLTRFERVAVPLAALTSGEAIVLAPVYAVRAILNNRARLVRNSNQSFLTRFNDDLLVLGALSLAALLNFSSRGTLPPQEPATFKIQGLLQAYAYGFVEPITGVLGPAAIWKSSHAGYAALAIGLGLVLIALAIRRGRAGLTIWLAVLCAMLVPLLTALVRAHAQASILHGPSVEFAWARYAFQVAPFAFVAWLAALPEKRWAQPAALALILLAVVLGAPIFRLHELAGPRWRDELREARELPAGPCATGAQRVVLRIAPEGWSAQLPAAAICPRR